MDFSDSPPGMDEMFQTSHKSISTSAAVGTMKKCKNSNRNIEGMVDTMEPDIPASIASRAKRVAGIMLGYALIIVVLYNLDTTSLNFYRQRRVLRRYEHSITGGAVPVRRARVMWGIFSGDFEGDEVYRDNLRLMLSMDPIRVCSLDKYIEEGNYDDSPCELIYTFVAGALKEGPTERLGPCEMMTVSQPVYEPFTTDFGYKDMTLLNIKENMEHGKSQTWLAYAGCLMSDYGIDYVAKTDTDSVPLLDKYFDYAEHNLPPAPYNINILSGSIVSKENWGDEQYDEDREMHFRKSYGKMHVYAEGQWYLLSKDLAASTVAIAANKTDLTYLEYTEDHDISTMAFISVDAMHLILISRENRHWIHPVKQTARARFKNVWERELNRTAHLYNYQPYLDAHPELAVPKAEAK